MTAEPEPAAAPSALKLGETLELTGASITVQELKQDTGASFPESGERWAGALVKSCIINEGSTLSWGPWSVADGDGGMYEAASSKYEDWPTPEYPFAGERVFQPGQCAKGWILFGVPKGTKVTSVEYGNSSGESGSWAVG